MQIRYGILAVVVSLVTVASTLTTGQAPASAVPAAPAAQAEQSKVEQPDQPVTVTGCIVREADYRRTQGAGKGGAAGTGVGVGNEFVLTSVSTASTSGSSTATSTAGASAGTPRGTSGVAAMAVYELSGANEAKAEQFVGRRVEISGTLKKADVGAAGPTGGPTAGKPPSGIDVTSSDLKLRELEVASVREATGACPAQ